MLFRSYEGAYLNEDGEWIVPTYEPAQQEVFIDDGDPLFDDDIPF